MAYNETKLLDSLSGEILSSERIGRFMGFGGGLGAGQVFIPDDPSVVFDQLWWNHAFAMYVYRDIIEKDDKLSSDLDTRMEAVLAKSRIVKPASEKRQDKRAADFISETLEGYMGGGDGVRFGFSNFLWEALDAIGKGVAIGENVFDFASDRVFIRGVNFKPQAFFNFAEGDLAPYANYSLPQTGPLRIRADLGFAIGDVDPEQPLPEKKFFVHTFRPYQGNRFGSPLSRRVFWLTYFKKAGLKAWLRYNERGSGTVLARYNAGGAADEKQKALELAQAVAEEASAAVGKGTEVEVLENVRASLGSSHNELVDRCDNAIARVILGQTLTSRGSEGGGSRALGEVHERVAERKTEVDSISLMLAVNTQLVFPLVLLNMGPVQRPPIWTIQYEPGADLKLMSEIIYRAWQMGLPIGKKYYYTTMQMPEPAEGEEILPPPAKDDQDSPPPGGTSNESPTFAEDDPSLLKKKSGNRRLKPPISKTERFARLRPTTLRSSVE
jgi:phage gp29-like protein